MTGADHYAEAERLRVQANNVWHSASTAQQSVLLQAAQVHATLAVAAALLPNTVHVDGNLVARAVGSSPRWQS